MWKWILTPSWLRNLLRICYDKYSSDLHYIDTRWINVAYIHTDKSQATPHFFGDTVLEVAERKMLVMEIEYFEFYCKSYYFYEHLELKW